MSWKTTKDPRIKKRGDTYYARFSKRGIRVEDSLYTTNFALAVDLVNKLEKAILNDQNYKEILDPNYKEEEQVVLIADLFPEFIKDKTSGNPKLEIKKVRAKTLLGYTGHWEKYFKDYWGPRPFTDVTTDEWEKYIDYARNKSVKKDKLKIFNHWKIFSAICSWALTRSYLTVMPKLYNPDSTTFQDELEEKDGIGINLSDSQLLDLRQKSKSNLAFHLCVSIAVFMGMRSSEITQLEKDRIDLNSQVIRLRIADTKTKQARTVPIHPTVLPILIAQMQAFPESPYLFPNRVDESRPMDTTGFKKSWYSLLDACGIICRFHDIRHSYATRVFAIPSINPVVACKALGMSMKTAMKYYIHFSEEQLSTLNRFELAA